MSICRRDILAGIAAFTASPCLFRARPTDPFVTHVIRLHIKPDDDPALREKAVRTFVRFKQIRSPGVMIVGRDVSADDRWDFAQISTFTNEARFRNYFYDPIHLAADREAEVDQLVDRATSFDILPGWSHEVALRLTKIIEDRAPRFAIKDNRPRRPPVPDRANDMLWNFGESFFRVTRTTLDPSSSDYERRRLAILRVRNAEGARVFSVGRETRSERRNEEHWTTVVRFQSELAHRNFIQSPEIRGLEDKLPFTAAPAQVFFVVDPAATQLADRLRSMLTAR